MVDVVTMLTFDELTSLQDKFRNYPLGMKIEQFVASMLNILRIDEKGEQVKLAVRLKELFEQVDVNGDGSMEWEEFSSFCINNGIKKTHKDKLDQTYAYRADRMDLYHHGGFFRRLRYLPEISKIVACEGGKLSLKVYDLNPKTKAVQLLHEQKTTLGKGTAGAAVDAAYAHCYKMLICSHDDMRLRLYDMSCYSVDRARLPAHPTFLKEVRMDSNQVTLCWDSRTKRLFSSGIDGTIHIWNFKVQVDLLEVTPAGHLAQEHSDIVKDMLVLPENNILVTAGMDSQICLWDTSSDTLKSKRLKHKQGVHSLATVGDGYVLSAGFDCDMYCWNFNSTSYEPYFVLSKGSGGHQNPVLGIVACAQSKYAFSIDVNGSLRWWDVRLDSTILDSERCLQSFGMRDLSGKTCSFRPSALGIWPAASPDEYPVVIATDANIHLFTSTPKHPEVPRVSCVQFNATTLSLFVAFGNDVQVWDCDSGTLLRQLHDVAPCIGQLCLDDRERKFVVGSGKGMLTIHDCETGSLLKTAQRHSAEVVGVYYVDRDKCFITCSSDRTLSLHDDRFVDSVPLLRSVSNAHSRDIVTTAFSYALSLIATGDSNGQIRVWDFQFFSLEKPMYPCISDVEITALTFVEPYPLLLAADTDGHIWAWATRRPGVTPSDTTFQQPLALLDFWNANFITPGSHGKSYHGVMRGATKKTVVSTPVNPSDSQVTSMTVTYDAAGGREIMPGIREGKYYLFASLHNGWVFQLDLTPAIEAMGLQPISEDKFPVNANNYFARRRFQRDEAKVGCRWLCCCWRRRRHGHPWLAYEEHLQLARSHLALVCTHRPSTRGRRSQPQRSKRRSVCRC